MSWIPDKGFHWVLKKGLIGSDVRALQLNLNLLLTNKIKEDGIFGDFTEKQVIAYQRNHGLVADGIAGGATQKSLGKRLLIPAWRPFSLPAGLGEGLVEAESSWAVGCVNWSAPGGVDCGWIQDRVFWNTGPEEISDQRWYNAFSGAYGGAIIGSEFRSRHDSFWSYRNTKYYGVRTHEDAWKYAALGHNWPAGADKLARGIALSEQPAQWVIDIGAIGVTSPADWARFYIGKVTKLVTNYTP